MRAFLALPTILALVLGGLGCVTKSTHTEGDRQVNAQTRGAAEAVEKSVEQVRSTLPEGSEGWTMLGLGLRALSDVKANSDQQEQVHGAPKESKPYTAENAKAARERSTQEHSESGLTKILIGAGSVVATAVGAWFGMPWLAGIFPKLAGVWGKVGQTGIQIVTQLRKEAEAGGSITPKRILEVAKEYNVTAGVQDLVSKEATALEEKLGYTPTIKLDAPTTAPTPTP